MYNIISKKSYFILGIILLSLDYRFEKPPHLYASQQGSDTHMALADFASQVVAFQTSKTLIIIVIASVICLK